MAAAWTKKPKLTFKQQCKKYERLIAKMALIGYPLCKCRTDLDSYGIHWRKDAPGSGYELGISIDIPEAKKMVGE